MGAPVDCAFAERNPCNSIRSVELQNHRLEKMF